MLRRRERERRVCGKNKRHAAGLEQVIHFVWKWALRFTSISHCHCSHSLTCYVLTQAFGSYIVDINSIYREALALSLCAIKHLKCGAARTWWLVGDFFF